MSTGDVDQNLEARIDDAYQRMVKARDPKQQKNAWDEIVILVRQRSPAQILRMENLRRLAR